MKSLIKIIKDSTPSFSWRNFYCFFVPSSSISLQSISKPFLKIVCPMSNQKMIKYQFITSFNKVLKKLLITCIIKTTNKTSLKISKKFIDNSIARYILDFYDVTPHNWFVVLRWCPIL